MMPPRIDVIEDERGFDALRPRWNALLDSTGAWNPFLTWEWMRSWWSHLRGTAMLHILTVSESDELIAIAPLMIVRRGFAPLRLEFIATGSGADYLDVIVKPGCHTVALPTLARAVARRQLALHLDNLPPNATAAGLLSHLNTTGWTAINGRPDICPFIDLSCGSWDAYLSTLGSSHRANVRRRLRALDRNFDVRFAAISTHQDRRQALEVLFAFHEQRWARGGSTAFSDAPHRAFHQDVTRRALDEGWLRLYELYLDGASAGVMYGFARYGRFYFFQHGSDAAFASSSLGLALMALSIQAAIDEGLHEFDMLYGHEAYKALWARNHRPLGRLMVFPPRLMGRWLQRRAETRQALRAFAHRIGMKGTHDAA